MKSRRSSSSAKSVVDAAVKADVGALEAMQKAGADLNAQHRGYRALHALVQTKPHADATAPSVIAAYENRIEALEDRKIVLAEKIAMTRRPVRSFDETARTALRVPRKCLSVMDL